MFTCNTLAITIETSDVVVERSSRGKASYMALGFGLVLCNIG